MSTVAALCAALEAIADPSLAESWDNVGLLLGDPSDAIRRVLLTIDLSERVLDEGLAQGCEAIVAYHPPIFAPLRRLTVGPTKERIILRAARAGLAVYSPHTALDAAVGGVNDWLAEGVGAGRVTALSPHTELPPGESVKVVTFCPREDVDRVREALAEAGAGRIGGYEQCSFASDGTGTFLGGDGTTPAVGSAGHLERVPEQRLEMVCGQRELASVLAALHRLHPYEEAPIEVHPLHARPRLDVGAGRRVALEEPVTLDELTARLRSWLGVEWLDVGPADDAAPDRPIEVVGVCAGSGKSLLPAALAGGCGAFLTGEMDHHETCAAQASGCAVLLAGHTQTERGYLPRLGRRLGEALPGTEVVVSAVDRPPLDRRSS